MPRKNQSRGRTSVTKRKAEEMEIEVDPMAGLTPIEKDILQVTEMVQAAVDRGYGIEGPASMLNMLKVTAPKALCEFKEDRHRYQSQMVDLLSNCIINIKVRMDTNLNEMNAKQASADEVKAGLEKIREECETEVIAKNETFTNARDLMKTKIDEMKKAEKLLRQFNKDLIVKQDALKELEEKKREIEEVFNVHFKFLMTEPIPEPVAPEPVVEEAPVVVDEIMAEIPAEIPAPVETIEAAPAEPIAVEAPIEAAPAPEEPVVEAEPVVEEVVVVVEAPKLNRKDSTKILLKKLTELELEMSCLFTLKDVLKKTPPVAGFDSSVVKYAENWILKQIMAFGTKISESVGSIETQNIEIKAGDAALQASIDERCHATEDMEKAKESKKETSEKFKASEKAIKAHVQEHKEMHDRMIKLNRWVDEFQFCITGFRMLEQRSKPAPIVKEPAAPAEPVVVMAEC